jgi:hypothetical protein
MPIPPLPTQLSNPLSGRLANSVSRELLARHALTRNPCLGRAAVARYSLTLRYSQRGARLCLLPSEGIGLYGVCCVALVAMSMTVEITHGTNRAPNRLPQIRKGRAILAMPLSLVGLIPTPDGLDLADMWKARVVKRVAWQTHRPNKH